MHTYAMTKSFILICSAQGGIRRFSAVWGSFLIWNIDSEWNDLINFFVSWCSVVELFICRNHKNRAFNSATTASNKYTCACMCCGWNITEALDDFTLLQNSCKWLKTSWSFSNSACAWSTKLDAWTHNRDTQYIHVAVHLYGLSAAYVCNR